LSHVTIAETTVSAGGRDFKPNPPEQRQPPPDLFLLRVWRLVPSDFLVLPDEFVHKQAGVIFG
jgi:hypothetical protein